VPCVSLHAMHVQVQPFLRDISAAMWRRSCGGPCLWTGYGQGRLFTCATRPSVWQQCCHRSIQGGTARSQSMPSIEGRQLLPESHPPGAHANIGRDGRVVHVGKLSGRWAPLQTHRGLQGNARLIGFRGTTTRLVLPRRGRRRRRLQRKGHPYGTCHPRDTSSGIQVMLGSQNLNSDIVFSICYGMAVLRQHYLLTGCKFQVPQNARRLINVYAINFMP
jgi:hypothetical protein